MSTQGTNNTPNRIFVDPAQGQQALQAIKERQEHFLSLLSDFGDSLVRLNNASSSNAINQATQVGAALQAQLADIATEGVGQYCEQAVQVINNWQKVHATAALPLTYARPTFTPVVIPSTNVVQTAVSPNLLKLTIEDLHDKLNEMLDCYDNLNGHVENSSQWWQGLSGDLSRQTWNDQVYSLRSVIRDRVSAYLGALANIGQDLAFRDSGEAGNSEQDLIKWQPQVLQDVYGQLSNLHYQLQHLNWELESPTGGTGILGQVGVWGQYQAMLDAIGQTLSGLNNFLNVQEDYLTRINAPYQPISTPTIE